MLVHAAADHEQLCDGGVGVAGRRGGAEEAGEREVRDGADERTAVSKGEEAKPEVPARGAHPWRDGGECERILLPDWGGVTATRSAEGGSAGSEGKDESTACGRGCEG